MAAATRRFGNLAISGLDLDRVGEAPGSEGKGMEKAVRSLCSVFPKEVMRRMAVVTPGHSAVAGFRPAVQLVAHHVAVCAGCGIVQQVGITLRLDESVAAEANEQPDYDGDRQLELPEESHSAIPCNYGCCFDAGLGYRS